LSWYEKGKEWLSARKASLLGTVPLLYGAVCLWTVHRVMVAFTGLSPSAVVWTEPPAD